MEWNCYSLIDSIKKLLIQKYFCKIFWIILLFCTIHMSECVWHCVCVCMCRWVCMCMLVCVCIVCVYVVVEGCVCVVQVRASKNKRISILEKQRIIIIGIKERKSNDGNYWYLSKKIHVVQEGILSTRKFDCSRKHNYFFPVISIVFRSLNKSTEFTERMVHPQRKVVA